jgi:homoserine O-acetyltransferase
LDYNGKNFPKWFDPLSFLYIVKAINIYDLSRGFDSLEDALKRVVSKLYLISFKSDMLFFPQEMQEIKLTMDKIGKRDICEYDCINSDYGHDGFLVEVDKFSDRIANILEE